MASEQELLLQSDTEMIPAPDPNATPDAVFRQFAVPLDTKLDQKLESFKRSLDEKNELHEFQLKKLKA